MFDIEGSFDRQLLTSGKSRPTILFPEALDPRIIEAACHLTRFARPVFLASEQAVRDTAARTLPDLDPTRLAFALAESAFVDIPSHPELVEEFAQAHMENGRREGREISLAEAREFASQPVNFGILAVAQGHGDTVVGGAASNENQFFRPMVRMLAAQADCCEAGVFVLPDEHPDNVFAQNIVVFGDVGVNATMTPELLAKVAVGTCAVARDLIPEDVLPHIHGAIVSHSNRGSDEGPSPALVRQATQLVPALLEERMGRGKRYQSISIQGEVKVSVALSRRSATYYQPGQDLPWPGAANVIICPNLDMGSMLYHLYAIRFPDAKKFPVMFGLRFKGVDLAMDCTPEDIRLAVKASVVRMYRYGAWRETPKDTFFRRYRVLAINPGSTSTKIAVYEGEHERFTQELQHTAEELKPFEGQPVTAQFGFRKDAILAFLAQSGLDVAGLDAVAGRGGVLWPVAHGTYTVNETMAQDLLDGVQGDHASNLGGLIARELLVGSGRPAFIVDPVVVDEVPARAKITGIKAIRRIVISHALNQIATARRYAEEQQTFYERINVIVAHMGGGISVGAHHHGHYQDVNNALDGEGPFTPQRSGSLPVGQLIELCFSGQYTHDQLKKLNKGSGGLIDLLGTADLRELERRYQTGEAEVVEVMDAMAYQIAKWITSMLPAFDGEKVDQILLTGGMARCKPTVAYIQRAVAAAGSGVTVYPGENEMAALAKGALRVLSGKEAPRVYTGRKR
ncbi:MAG: butyrate kinase [Holophaga sp.]|nr:butyrate kinase [Holophaga sp.]